MENTTNNETRDYIFVYKSDVFDFVNIINDAVTFKDALYKLCKAEGTKILTSYDVFEQVFIGFCDSNIDGMISLYNHFSDYKIDKVYLIDRKVFDREEG